MNMHAEAPLDAATIAGLEGSSGACASLIGAAMTDSPEVIVAKIDAFVFAWQSGNRPSKKVVTAEDAPFILGSLWGQQLVRAFNWEWRMVTFHDHGDTMAPGVLSSK